MTPGTVAKAYQSLEQQGLIETVRGKGTYVIGIPERTKVRDEGVVKKVRESLREQCMELIYQGMDKGEILDLVTDVLENLQGGETNND